jgi:hypothetical protein
MMADKYGLELPDFVPETVIVADSKGKSHVFEIEFMLHGHINSLRATEIHSKTQYECHLYSLPDEPFSSLWNRAVTVINRLINTRYMDAEHGQFLNDKAIGYIREGEESETYEIVIDGKPYSWNDLYTNVQMRPGFRIKIEFAEDEEKLF